MDWRGKDHAWKKKVSNIKKTNSGEKWSLFLALGIILVINGILASIYVIPAAFVSVFFIGSFMIFAELVQIIHAFTVMRWGQFMLWLLAGILYTIAGLICFFNPFAAVPILTLALALVFIFAGLIRMITGFRYHYIPGAVGVIINGIVTALLGIIIITMGCNGQTHDCSQWMLSSWWVFGILVAIDLIFQGIGWIVFAFGLKAASR